MDFVQFNHLPVSSIEVIDGVAFVAGNQNGVLKYGESNAIQENSILSFGLHPNPTKNQIFVSELEIGTSIAITDVFGRLVLSEDVSDSEQVISTDKLTSGTYIITISKEGSKGVQKFIKE